MIEEILRKLKDSAEAEKIKKATENIDPNALFAVLGIAADKFSDMIKDYCSKVYVNKTDEDDEDEFIEETTNEFDFLGGKIKITTNDDAIIVESDFSPKEKEDKKESEEKEVKTEDFMKFKPFIHKEDTVVVKEPETECKCSEDESKCKCQVCSCQKKTLAEELLYEFGKENFKAIEAGKELASYVMSVLKSRNDSIYSISDENEFIKIEVSLEEYDKTYSVYENDKKFLDALCENLIEDGGFDKVIYMSNKGLLTHRSPSVLLFVNK